MRFTLGKDEKLKSRKSIAELFQNGSSVKSFPIKMIYTRINEGCGTSMKVAFSVPKRKFKLAVDRNRIKRMMRECYRQNKHSFYMEAKSYNVMFIYMGAKEPIYKELESKFLKVKNKFIEEEIANAST